MQALGLPTQPCTKPFRIIFANASSTICTHYANFGSIIGKVAIVDTAPDTLLSISSLTARGYEVRFNRHLPLGIYSRDGSLIFTGTQDPHTRLFHFDIASLLNPTTDTPLHSNTQSATANRAVKQPPLDPNLVKEVMWLH